MMQVSCLLQLKQRLCLISGNWTPSIPDCLMFCLSSPALFRFLAYGSLHEVLAWEASGCSNDNVFAKLPSQGRHSPYQVSNHGPLGW